MTVTLDGIVISVNSVNSENTLSSIVMIEAFHNFSQGLIKPYFKQFIALYNFINFSIFKQVSEKLHNKYTTKKIISIQFFINQTCYFCFRSR